MGVCIIIAAIIYVFGTRYQAVTIKTFDVERVFVYDRMTGNAK